MNDFVINEELAQIIKEFSEQKKPIGMSSNAGILAAKFFKGCTITLGDDTIKAKMEKLGAKLVNAGPEDVIVDKHNRLITTQGFNSNNIKPHQVFKAMENMVNATVDYVDVVEGEVSKKSFTC